MQRQSETSKGIVLHAGCGERSYPDTIGLDFRLTPTTDIVADLNQPLPFADSSLDGIACHQVIEHVESVVFTMQEFHRVLKPGGHLEIITPHYTYRHSWEDPTHRWHLMLSSFYQFEPGKNAFGFEGGFKVIDSKVHLGGPIGKLLMRVFSPLFIDRQITKHYSGKDIWVSMQAIKEKNLPNHG